MGLFTKEEKEPVVPIQSITMKKLDDFAWAVLLITTEGNLVTNVEQIGTPNVYAIAVETFKKTVANTFFKAR